MLTSRTDVGAQRIDIVLVGIRMYTRYSLYDFREKLVQSTRLINRQAAATFTVSIDALPTYLLTN